MSQSRSRSKMVNGVLKKEPWTDLSKSHRQPIDYLEIEEIYSDSDSISVISDLDVDMDDSSLSSASDMDDFDIDAMDNRDKRYGVPHIRRFGKLFRRVRPINLKAALAKEFLNNSICNSEVEDSDVGESPPASPLKRSRQFERARLYHNHLLNFHHQRSEFERMVKKLFSLIWNIVFMILIAYISYNSFRIAYNLYKLKDMHNITERITNADLPSSQSTNEETFCEAKSTILIENSPALPNLNIIEPVDPIPKNFRMDNKNHNKSDDKPIFHALDTIHSDSRVDVIDDNLSTVKIDNDNHHIIDTDLEQDQFHDVEDLILNSLHNINDEIEDDERTLEKINELIEDDEIFNQNHIIDDLIINDTDMDNEETDYNANVEKIKKFEALEAYLNRKEHYLLDKEHELFLKEIQIASDLYGIAESGLNNNNNNNNNEKDDDDLDEMISVDQKKMKKKASKKNSDQHDEKLKKKNKLKKKESGGNKKSKTIKNDWLTKWQHTGNPNKNNKVQVDIVDGKQYSKKGKIKNQLYVQKIPEGNYFQAE